MAGEVESGRVAICNSVDAQQRPSLGKPVFENGVVQHWADLGPLGQKKLKCAGFFWLRGLKIHNPAVHRANYLVLAKQTNDQPGGSAAETQRQTITVSGSRCRSCRAFAAVGAETVCGLKAQRLTARPVVVLKSHRWRPATKIGTVPHIDIEPFCFQFAPRSGT